MNISPPPTHTSRFPVKTAPLADVFSRPPFRAGACSTALLLCLGALSAPALAQPAPVDISSGTVNHHVCGNGTAGSSGDGNCGADSDPDSFDDTATTGNSVSITGSASVDNPSYGGANYHLYTVYGAFNSGIGERAVEGNQVTIDTSGTIQGDVTGGSAQSDNADARAENNRVDFNAGTVTDGALHGGYAESSGAGDAIAKDNHVVFVAGTVSYSLHGGYASNNGGTGIGHADHNTLEMSGGTAQSDAIGGHANSTDIHAQATRNSFILSGNARVNGKAYGGYADSSNVGKATVEENTLTISGSAQVAENAYGANAGGNGAPNAVAKDNRLTLSGGAAIDGSAFGANAVGEVNATATENTITISGGSVAGGYGWMKGVAGGAARATKAMANAVATKNHAIISGGTVGDPFANANVYGGHALSGELGTTPTATFNTTTISGSAQVNGDAFGGAAFAQASGGDRNDAVATENTITVSGGNVTGTIGVVGGRAVSEAGDATAEENKAFISGNATIGDVYGAYATGYDKATTEINKIEMSGGSVSGSLHGGLSQSDQGLALARANTIRMSGGTANEVHGGKAQSNNGAAKASGNEVEISGGEVTDLVVGGFAESQGGLDAFATKNTVTLSGTPTLDLARLHGGLGSGGAGSDFFTGNTLNIKTSGLIVASLQNFEFLNFYLPSTLGNGQAMLTVTNTADLTDGGSRSATVSLAIDGTSLPLQAGEHVVLIDAGAGTLTGNPANTQATAHGTQGATLEYDFSLTTDANRLIATLDKVSVREESKSISEGYLSGTALLAQGSGFLARQGVNAARDALREEDPVRPRTFAALSGGKIRHETGSHVDVKGYTLITGFAQGFRTNAGDALLAGFFEYGKGDYTSLNSFASGKVKGEGDTAYKGIGFLGRFDFGNAAYVEGSVRGGRTETDFRSNDIRDARGERVRYETRNGYLGAHLGAGREWKLDAASTLDTYAQALLTHQGTDAVRLSTGERVKFEAIDSRRLKAGARIKRAFSPGLTGYAGVAYDHEFSGKAQATTGGQKIDAPSLKGGTGSVELGLTGRPSASRPLYLNFGIQGYTGKREGLTASFRVNYLF